MKNSNKTSHSNKIYILIDVDYGMYEGEKDYTKLNYISANKEKFLEAISKYATNTFNDMSVHVIDESDFDKSLDITLSSEGTSIQQFLKENNYALALKNKINFKYHG